MTHKRGMGPQRDMGPPRGMGPPLNLPYIPRAPREPLWLRLCGVAMLLAMLAGLIAGGFIAAQIIHDALEGIIR